MSIFIDSDEKIKRAKKHINDLVTLMQTFADSDFYAIAVEEVRWTHGWLRNELVVTLDPNTEFRMEAALIIGDALHNLRSALDLLYYKTIRPGSASAQTRFPILDRREEFERIFNSAFKQQQITQEIADLIRDTIKPYETGNRSLWALHKLNIRDKHELLIPLFKMVRIAQICLINEQNIIFEYRPILTTDSFRRYLPEDEYGRYPKVHDKGKAAAGIGFEFSVPFAGESVISTLNSIAEEVTRTIEAFKIAGFV